ncbi:hypothetical protein A7J71_19595 [Achromobacter insolitus]|uniref:hypothetical protein n=1 Tax=Achromobacter insolitus TaxID=217204 RepID=UPI0007C7BF6A|nr:hypothetical protein [Achromobacter insolitus]OAE64091.1 hypothetical protein A7J71_19595 [Achromobacter insolitus]OCZ57859.1 hypothetical protein A7P22_11930 [Achromobacter insolitus]
MALRKKAPRRTSYRLVAMPGSPNQLVLGLKWRTVLGEDLQKLALQAARKARATHYVQSDSRSSSVGLLTAKGRENRTKTRASIFSAAAAFGQMHRHGTHAVVCELPDQSVWLAVVIDGAVQAGGDTIFQDRTAAQETVTEATTRYSDLQLHSNYWPQARPFSLPQLTAYANAQTALKRATFRLSMVSPIWWVLIALVLAYEAWDFGMSWWEERQAQLQAQLQAVEPQLDPEALWNSAIGAWAKSIKTQGNEGLDEVVNAILSVPVEPGRWRLTEVDCQPQARSCTAKFRRTRLADNHSLKAALPGFWQISHLDLETASAKWNLPSARLFRPLQLQELPSPEDLRLIWEPRWQGLLPALLDFRISNPSQVPIAVPNVKLPNGLEQPVPMPKSIRLPASRSLIINAPLRSLYGLDLPVTAELTQLQVRYMPETTPALTASAFPATLKGTLYVLAP